MRCDTPSEEATSMRSGSACFEKEGMVHFEVKDNGQGIEEERLEQLGKMVVSSKKGTGTALYNINERLIGLFGKETMLHIESELNEGTEVTLLFRKSRGGRADC